MKTFTRLALAAALVVFAPRGVMAAAPRSACSLIGSADIVASTGRGPTGPLRSQAYRNDPGSQCYIPTSAGTIQASLFPVRGDKQMSSIRAGFSPLEAVQGMGDEAVYSTRYSTLAIRHGAGTLMLSLASPDAAQNRRILFALGKRVAPKIR